MRSERISILFNPSAGMGRALKMRGALEERLRRHGILYDLAVTESGENLRDLARAHAKKYGIVVGAGGDSTFQIVVNEIMRGNADVSFGMIAVGSSNDIAKEFGVDTLEKACLALKGQRIKKIDIGCIYDCEKPTRFFLGQANLGVGVFVNQYVAGLAQGRSRLAKHQTAAGVLGIIRAYRNKRIPLPLIVESDAVRMDGEFVAAVISNVRYWASGKLINPNALPDDGRLDLCLIRKCSLARLARISSLANRGKHARAKEVKFFQAPSFEISSERPFEIQTDGEILKSLDHPTPFKKITFKIVPQCLNIVL